MIISLNRKSSINRIGKRLKDQAKFKTISAAVFAVLSLGFLVFVLVMSLGSFGNISDLPEFYAAARMVIEGRGVDVYVLEQQRIAQHALFPTMPAERTIGFFLNPFALPFIVPLGLVPLDSVQYVWKGLLVIALAGAIWLARKIYDLDLRGTLWLVAVVSCSAPAFEALRIDQISSLIFVAFLTAILAIKADRPIIAALALSFMLLKPQLLLPLILFLLGAQRYKILFWLTVMGAVLAALGLLEITPQGLVNYKSLIDSTATDSRYLQTTLSPTVRGQLFRILPESKGIVTTVTYALFALCLVVEFFLGRFFAKSHKWLEAAVLCSIPLGMVLSPYFFAYDLLVVLPSLVVLMKEPLQNRIPPWMLLSGMLGAMVFTIPVAAQVHYEYLMKDGIINPFFVCFLCFALACVWLAIKNKPYFDEFV